MSELPEDQIERILNDPPPEFTQRFLSLIGKNTDDELRAILYRCITPDSRERESLAEINTPDGLMDWLESTEQIDAMGHDELVEAVRRNLVTMLVYSSSYRNTDDEVEE